MNYKTKEQLKKAGIVLAIAAGVLVVLFYTVPAVKAKLLEAWEWLKGLCAKKK